MDGGDLILQARTGLMDKEAIARQWEQAYKNVRTSLNYISVKPHK